MTTAAAGRRRGLPRARPLACTEAAQRTPTALRGSPPCLRAARRGRRSRRQPDAAGRQSRRWRGVLRRQARRRRLDPHAMIDPPRVLSEEPTAVTPHDGICGGKSQQWLRLGKKGRPDVTTAGRLKNARGRKENPERFATVWLAANSESAWKRSVRVLLQCGDRVEPCGVGRHAIAIVGGELVHIEFRRTAALWGVKTKRGLLHSGRRPMIKSFVTAAALTIGLAGYAWSQEAAPAAPTAPVQETHHHHHHHHWWHHHHHHHHMHHEMAPAGGAPAEGAPAGGAPAGAAPANP